MFKQGGFLITVFVIGWVIAVAIVAWGQKARGNDIETQLPTHLPGHFAYALKMRGVEK